MLVMCYINYCNMLQLGACTWWWWWISIWEFVVHCCLYGGQNYDFYEKGTVWSSSSDSHCNAV